MRPRSILFFCLIALSVMVLSACGGQKNTAGTSPTEEAMIQRGKLVFQANCSACHSIGEEIVLVGPSMQGIAARGGEMVSGLDARAYIEQSILEPGAYVHEGYQDLMPNSFGTSLSAEDLDAVIAYLMTLN